MSALSTGTTDVDQITGCFQFFYSSKECRLPHPDVPTRDVTNTARAGYKTEPLLERQLENWCECRAKFVVPRVREALAVTASGGRHYMILTTTHPKTREELAVGILEFSRSAYGSLMKRYPNQWNARHQPYTGGPSSKLIRFCDAFSLEPWMISQKPPTKYVPGKRYGIVKAPTLLLNEILQHFEALPDCTSEFLANVRCLEGRLKCNGPQWAWKDYQDRMHLVSKNRCHRSSGSAC